MGLLGFLQKSVANFRVVNVLCYFSPVTLCSLCVIVVLFFVYNKRRSRVIRLMGKIPGPPALPFIGNTIEINVDHDELFSRLTGAAQLFGNDLGVVRGWVGSVPWVILYQPEVAEPILSSPKHTDKSPDYMYLRPWLGTGLLTSSGKKWHARRKILTPTFHFRILEDFIDVFHEQSVLMAKRMEKEIDKMAFNIFPYVALCTLDIVCETAMGRQVHAQENSDSDYVKAINQIGSIVLSRQSKMWLQLDWIFRWTKMYKDHERCLNILHGFSNKVISERKEEIKQTKNIKNNVNNEDEAIGKKKRLAFLDLLIEASQDGDVLSDEDIREEVDTFMFEGHDTTSAAISWCLFLLGTHPDIQERVLQELHGIFGEDTSRCPTMNELHSMRYLECCIKEALRLYPSVPLIARKLNEDVNIGAYAIPEGTTAMIVTYMLHRDPKVFPNPERFDPDRFLPENCHGRHPYAYIPFSAGPRNCIGQKFAILEEKSVISTLIRKYRVEAMDRREDLTLLGELILRPKDGLRMRIHYR